MEDPQLSRREVRAVLLVVNGVIFAAAGLGVWGFIEGHAWMVALGIIASVASVVGVAAWSRRRAGPGPRPARSASRSALAIAAIAALLAAPAAVFLDAPLPAPTLCSAIGLVCLEAWRRKALP